MPVYPGAQKSRLHSLTGPAIRYTEAVQKRASEKFEIGNPLAECSAANREDYRWVIDS